MKRTVILLGILTLLVFITLNRWDIRPYLDGKAQVRIDKITAQTQFVTISSERRYNIIVKENQYLIYGTTVFLYSAIAATTVALLLEAKKKE